jgi:capsular polysaccharide biosynthesis protein
VKILTRLVDAISAVLRPQPDPYFRSKEDVEHTLDLPVLATCPARKER